MDITWYGKSCFRIAERGQPSVVTDPHGPAEGAPELKLRADLVTISHCKAGHSVEQVRNHRYVISGPGEYELGDLFVTGIPLHLYDAENDKALDNVAYHFEFSNSLSVLHLGKLREAPEQSSIEQLGEVNVLLLPVDAVAGLPSDQLADLISLIEPNYVVPMHQAGNGGRVEGYLKAMGLKAEGAIDQLRVSASGLPEQTQVALLRPSVVLD